MAEYRKKRVAIEAFRLGVDPTPDWFMEKVLASEIVSYLDREQREGEAAAEITTRYGVRTAVHGDYVVKEDNGEMYPLTAELFEACYERE